MTIEPAALEALQALVLGFAFAGLLASTFEFVTETRANRPGVVRFETDGTGTAPRSGASE